LFFNNGAGQVRQATITGSAGGTATGTITVFNNIDAIFFTISGAASGNVFTVAGLGNPGFNGNLGMLRVSLSTLTPEPSTVGGCAAAALAFICFGGKAQKNRAALATSEPIFRSF
jgi:hypothetical protein